MINIEIQEVFAASTFPILMVLADASVPASQLQESTKLAGIVAMIVTIATIATRYITVLKPLWVLIPERFQWILPALLAALTGLSVALPGTNTVVDLVYVVLGTLVVPIFLAAMQGAHPAPSNPKPDLSEKDL